MNPFEMVVLIVGITAIATVLRARYGVTKDKAGDEVLHGTALSNARLKDEVVQLKERIAVLERLATDENSARTLDLQIEKLR